MSSNETNDTKVVFPVEEFVEDADARLGRANGNMFVRIPGIPNVHDGQILVRLKKKRFVALDYGIVPTPSDMAVASETRHINCPNGAGKQKCCTPTCPKVGVPVLLFDSEPEEPTPLYLRSGLCFTCQRNLNEKRRTQRKRKGEEDVDGDHLTQSIPASSRAKKNQGESDYKRFKINDNILDLNPDAIIINGPLEGTRRYQEPGYEYSEIAVDIQACLEESVSDLQQLLLISSSETPATATVERNSDIVRSYEKAFLSLSKTIFLVNQWKASWDSVFHRDNPNVAPTAVTEDHSAFYGRDFADVVANAAAAAVAQSEQDIANILSDTNDKNVVVKSNDPSEETVVLGIAV